MEGIPSELKIFILKSISDFTSLKSFLQASREYYQIYDGIRSEILFAILLNQYNGQVDLVESLTSIRSKGLWASEKRNEGKIIALLDFRRRASREGGSSTKKIYDHHSYSIEEILRLIELHEVAVFFLQDYSKSLKQPKWWVTEIHAGDWETTVLPIQFSPNERARFFRAFYRFHTWCNIFGQQEYYPARPSENEFRNKWVNKTFSAKNGWRLIWGTMPPWEVEEVGCLWLYFKLKIEQIFKEITAVLVETYESENPNNEPSYHFLKHKHLVASSHANLRYTRS